jgi:asparagine synthase (glutamine-hydrolysing)
MRINPQDKMINKEHPMRKMGLRKAFEDMLPASVAWRKEQFSDGGYGWIDKLKEVAVAEVTDEQLANAKFRSVTNTYV